MEVKNCSLESTRPCPHCASTAQFSFRARDLNMRTSPTFFSYFRCPACTLTFIAEVPADLDRYYAPEYYALPESKRRLEVLAGKERFKLDLIRPYRSAGDLLEVGAAWGSFALAAKLAGYDVTAVEMDERCCHYLAEVVGVRVFRPDKKGALPAGLGQYDVVALWHVVEHLLRFEQALTQIAELVRPGGIVAIACPNPDAWQFRVMGQRWPHIDAPRHLQLIPAQVIIDVLTARGFEVMLSTSTDPGGLRWNRFGWQRLIMNALPTTGAATAIGIVGGAAVSTMLAPLDRRESRGATYTLILRRSGTVRAARRGVIVEEMSRAPTDA
jgi:2-polyprenyl-3-methyl-5-hydroxy-6-metoxy-1,4-benzoquinol methylase